MDLFALHSPSMEALEHGIETARGGVWLELAEEQYGKLLRR